MQGTEQRKKSEEGDQGKENVRAAATGNRRLNKRTKVKDNEHTILLKLFGQLCLPLRL